MRKGYRAEYKAKKELIKMFGEENVIKMAIGQACDFAVFKPNKREVEKIVEVKQTKKNKYYPLPREIEQTKRLIKFGENHQCPVERWIYFTKRREWIKEVLFSPKN